MRCRHFTCYQCGGPSYDGLVAMLSNRTKWHQIKNFVLAMMLPHTNNAQQEQIKQLLDDMIEIYASQTARKILEELNK